MKLRLTAMILLSLCLSQAFADEGMWLLGNLRKNKQAERVMKELGLQMPVNKLYNPKKPALANAVVSFGGFCSGVVVSEDGLVFTNHHCGFSSIQQHSSVEHDYLKDGFVARNLGEELPNPELYVRFLLRTEDVTKRVLSAAKHAHTESERRVVVDSVMNVIGMEVSEKDSTLTGIVDAYYAGNEFWLSVYRDYNDVRLVFAPPSSVGKFGWDTDNWMWPRHTGDFSLFRVYADANGNPAPYSETNVPLRPKRWLKLSLKGVEENDYAMIMGFPGRTNKYYTSWEVAERRDIDNAVRINIRNLRQEAMLEEMLKDPQVRIQYASKYAGSTNAYKNAIGSNWAINKRNFEQVKNDEQDRLIAWSKKMCEPAYPEALLTLEQIVNDRKDLRFRSWMLDEALSRGIEFSKVPTDIETVCEALEGKDRSEQQKQVTQLERAFHRFADKDYAPMVDKKIAKVMLKEYRRLVAPKSQPAYFSVIDSKFKGDVDKFVDYLFDKSIYGSEKNFNAFKEHPSVKTLREDPMILFAQSVKDEKKALDKALADFDAGYAIAHRAYVKGLLAMYGDLASFPDANSTLRLTYGQVKGYSPRDCDYYGHQTTLDGVMEKEDSTNWEFVVSARLKELYQAGDFGPYKMPNGKMPVAFCATTHTTGGNSGSPVLNGQGELIGINFDRNWEGVGGDIQYLPDYQRSIIVDIRYVLFVIDKYAGAGYLLNEMEFSR